MDPLKLTLTAVRVTWFLLQLLPAQCTCLLSRCCTPSLLVADGMVSATMLTEEAIQTTLSLVFYQWQQSFEERCTNVWGGCACVRSLSLCVCEWVGGLVCMGVSVCVCVCVCVCLRLMGGGGTPCRLHMCVCMYVYRLLLWCGLGVQWDMQWDNPRGDQRLRCVLWCILSAAELYSASLW